MRILKNKLGRGGDSHFQSKVLSRLPEYNYFHGIVRKGLGPPCIVLWAFHTVVGVGMHRVEGWVTTDSPLSLPEHALQQEGALFRLAKSFGDAIPKYGILQRK